MIMVYLTVFLLPLTIFVSVVNASYCDEIKQKYAPAVRYVSQNGEPRNISLYWDSDAARAAASLLSVILRHALGYQHVHLQQTSYKHPTFEKAASAVRKGLFQEIKLTLSMTLKPGYEDESEFDVETKSSIKQKLFVHISRSLRAKRNCAGTDVAQGDFYHDITRLTDCGFESSPTSGGRIMNVYHLESHNMITSKISLFFKASRLQVQFKELNRSNLFRKLRTGNQSFLFVDYNMWDGDEDVINVVLDLYLYDKYYRKQKDNNVVIATSMALSCGENEYAPQIFKISKKFTPSLQFLRPILEAESSVKSIDEGNCAMILRQNYTVIDKLMENLEPEKKHYKIITFTCDGNNFEFDFIYTLGNFLSKHYFIVDLMNYSGNCTDPYYTTDLLNYVSDIITPSHIGLVIGGLKNTADNNVSKVLDISPLPVFLYDAIDIDVDSTTSVWLTNGRFIHLVLALHHFIDSNDITQVAVLSEHTATAGCFNENLREVYGFRLFGYNLPINLTLHEATKVLHNIRYANKNIIVVNTNYDNAVTILSAAIKLKMNVDNKMTWILREWKHINITLNITYITFSFWSQIGNNTPVSDKLYEFKHKMETILPDYMWSPHIMAYTDAVLTVVKGFKDVMLKYKQARDDTQSIKVTQQFERSLVDISPVQVVFQNLTYKGHSPEEAVVFVDIWQGSHRKPLKRYKVNATSHSVHLEEKTESHSNLMGSGSTASLNSCSVFLTIAFLLSVTYGNSRYYIKV